MTQKKRGITPTYKLSKLAARRREMGITTKGMAALTGLSPAGYNSVERGFSHHPLEETKRRIATALGWSVPEVEGALPLWPITPYGGRPFRSERILNMVPRQLAERASRVCADFGMKPGRMIEQAVAELLDRLENKPNRKDDHEDHQLRRSSRQPEAT